MAANDIVTSVTSALSFFSWNKPQATANAFWKRDQGATVKCAVCKKRLGHRPALECDDCGSKFSPYSTVLQDLESVNPVIRS